LISFGEFLSDRLTSEDDESPNIESDTLNEILRIIRKLANMYEHFGETGNLKTLNSLFRQLLKQAGFPFIGEPLEGLQIMGLLETRNLDFKNIILLSVNENILPKSKSTNSFIPLDIANAFGLPTYRDRDSVSAYHFYRSIQRAENVWLVYNTESDEFGKGEKSRYISQIQEEFSNTKTSIISGIYIPEMARIVDTTIEIEKTNDFIEQFIERYSEHTTGTGLSPTALSSYLDCSLKFYFNYFSGVDIPDEKEEDIGADELGTITHDILENLYKPYEGEVITEEINNAMLQQLDKVAEQCFHKNKSRRNFDEGPALLIKYGILSSIRNFLKYADMSYQPGTPKGRSVKTLDLEKKLQRTIRVNIGSDIHSIKLGGKVDRIDLVETGEIKELRIIDYKTGMIKPTDVKFSAYSDIIEFRQNKILQLLMYEFIGRLHYSANKYTPGIISLRAPSLGLRILETKDEASITEEETEKFFISLVEKITSLKEPFVMTDDYEICKNCNFRGICNR
jgi:CRISPR/Cas system-associated exonuclease Cas4 (RecB family)